MDRAARGEEDKLDEIHERFHCCTHNSLPLVPILSRKKTI